MKLQQRIGDEELESILRHWAQNMWMEINKSAITDDKSRKEIERQFMRKWIPLAGWQTKGQIASEGAFMQTALALSVTLGRVSEKAVDRIYKTSLVEAWRKSIIRGGLQGKVNVFAGIMKEALGKQGQPAVIAAYPADRTATARDILDTIDYFRLMKDGPETLEIKDIIVRAAPRGAAKAPPGPKAL